MRTRDEDLVLNTSGAIRSDYDKLCPVGGVNIVDSEVLPLSLRAQCGKLINKCPVAFMTASGVSGGRIDYTVTFVRLDEKDQALKLHPANVSFNGDTSAASGLLGHHADFSGRTTYLTSGECATWAAFNANRSGSCPPLGSGFPTAISGAIADLRVPLLHYAHHHIRQKQPAWMFSG